MTVQTKLSASSIFCCGGLRWYKRDGRRRKVNYGREEEALCNQPAFDEITLHREVEELSRNEWLTKKSQISSSQRLRKLSIECKEKQKLRGGENFANTNLKMVIAS